MAAEALAHPGLPDEALGILRGLIERVVIHPAEDSPKHGLQVEIVGEIVKTGAKPVRKTAAFPKGAACSVKVVAGACNTLCLLLFATRLIGRR